MYNEKYLVSTWRTPEMLAIRDGVDLGLEKISEDERVVVVSADLASSVRISGFAEANPSRFLEVGVAEQNMAGIAAGLSFVGKIPFMASYATFSPGRNWEQIRVSIAMSNANVKIIGSHAGLSVGVNGPSHMATEDIALMRVLPNMTVLVPADITQCREAIEAAYKWNGPVYIRTVRGNSAIFTKPLGFEIGKIYRYRSGGDLTIAACGTQVYDALMIADQLAAEKGIEVDVLNISTVKPLDRTTLFESVLKTKKIVTIEDHQIAGGMGSLLCEHISSECPVPVLRLGIADKFGISGAVKDVYKMMELDRESLYMAIKNFVIE